MERPVLVARIALFAALVYVLSWGTSYLPNVNFVFFLVFSAGFLWGLVPGALVGAIGMGLWTVFNPYGMAPLPIAGAQVIGAAGSAVVGTVFRGARWHHGSRAPVTARLVFSALLCTVVFYLPVNTIDALLFQPFWPRFVGGAVWGMISLGFNAVIFPLLFQAIRYLYARESAFQ